MQKFDISINTDRLLYKYKEDFIVCTSFSVYYSFRSKVGFWLNFFNLVVYALFLGCLTATIIMVGPAPLQPNTNQTNSSAALKYEETVESYKDQVWWRLLKALKLTVAHQIYIYIYTL